MIHATLLQLRHPHQRPAHRQHPLLLLNKQATRTRSVLEPPVTAIQQPPTGSPTVLPSPVPIRQPINGKYTCPILATRTVAIILKRARKAAARPLPCGLSVERRFAEHDRARVGYVQAGDQVEGGRLAGTVGANETVYGAFRHVEADVVHSNEAAERDRETTHGQERRAHKRAPIRRGRKITMPRGMNNTATTMMRPFTTRRKSASGRSTSGSRVRMVEPSTGPSGEPMPPSSA